MTDTTIALAEADTDSIPHTFIAGETYRRASPVKAMFGDPHPYMTMTVIRLNPKSIRVSCEGGEYTFRVDKEFRRTTRATGGNYEARLDLVLWDGTTLRERRAADEPPPPPRPRSKEQRDSLTRSQYLLILGALMQPENMSDDKRLETRELFLSLEKHVVGGAR